MDSIEKNEQQNEDSRRISKGSDHSIDRQTGRKSRDKGNPNQKSEKSISSQKSPFKNKYVGDKQVARTPFGHSGLSSKSFSRRHMQDNGTTFYPKPVKLGKIAKELKKQPVDFNLTVKKGKSLKDYSPVRGSSDEQHPDNELLNATILSSSSMHLSSLDQSSNRSPDNNPPRHRKCYTNSKHTEYTKTLKFLDKGPSKEIKISHSIGDLNRNGSNSGDEFKYASADDIHAHIYENISIPNKDSYPKSNTTYYRCKTLAGSANLLRNLPSTAIPNTKPLSPQSEYFIPNSSPDITSSNFDFNSECNQSKSNLGYFYKGTENKINLEGSDPSGVKILLRGDLLGALNCLFPQLNLVASETNPKRPLLDPNFSYFSDSSEVLLETFSLARKLFNEQQKTSTENSINLSVEKSELARFKKNGLEDHCLYNAAKKGSDTHVSGKSPGSSHSNLRNTLSAKELSSSSTKDLRALKISHETNQQNILKFSQSEPKITGNGPCSSIMNSSSNGLDDLKRTNTRSQDYNKSPRDFENTLESEKHTCNCEYRRADMINSNQITQNYNKRCLYSSVLKSSVFNKDPFLEEKPIIQTTCCDTEDIQWSKNLSNINISSETTSGQDIKNVMKKNFNAVLRPPVCYDLDELERDITKSLEKILDESEDPVVMGQYSMQYPDASNTINTFSKNSTIPNAYLSNQAQKYNESYYRKPLVENSGLNSLQSRLNFLRTKGRPSDFEQFFNPLTFNTQLAAQFIRQDNIGNTLNPMQLDNHMSQPFPQNDLTKLNSSNMPYYQPNPTNPFDKDIKEPLTRYPQIMRNASSSSIRLQNLSAGNTNIATSSPIDFTSLYSHLAATKTYLSQLPQSLAKSGSADENMVLNQFIASQNLNNIYDNMTLHHYQTSSHKVPNQVPFDFSKQSSFGAMASGMLNTDSFFSPPYLDANNCPTSGIRTIISVSDLEKQALEQYRNSEESINARYDVLEKEAEEQYYNCLGRK